MFHREGWGRAQVQEALYRAARLPFRTMMLNKEREALQASHPELTWLFDTPDVALPVVEDPSCFDLIVVGGAAGRGTYFYGGGEPVTLAVED